MLPRGSLAQPCTASFDAFLTLFCNFNGPFWPHLERDMNSKRKETLECVYVVGQSSIVGYFENDGFDLETPRCQVCNILKIGNNGSILRIKLFTYL